MDASLVWPTLLPQSGAIVQAFLTYLNENTNSFIKEASESIRQIDIELSIGPLLDPTAYLGGQRFDNAAEYKRLLGGLIQLAKQLRRD